jgi:integrase
VVSFRNAEQAKKLAPKTVNHELKCLRMVFKTAKRDNLVSDNPLEFVEMVRNRGEKKRRPFSIAELQAVLSVADGEWRSMILFAFYTGQRLSDVATLTWANIDVERDELRLVTRKTDRAVVIPLPSPLRRHVAQLPSADNPNAPIHPRALAMVERQDGKTGNLSNQFADLLASAGLRKKAAHRKGEGPRENHELSFHSLRATATTLLHEAGIPASVAQALIGHDSAEIHQDYVKVGRDALRKAADSMPDILGG